MIHDRDFFPFFTFKASHQPDEHLNPLNRPQHQTFQRSASFLYNRSLLPAFPHSNLLPNCSRLVVSRKTARFPLCNFKYIIQNIDRFQVFNFIHFNIDSSNEREQFSDSAIHKQYNQNYFQSKEKIN